MDDQLSSSSSPYVDLTGYITKVPVPGIWSIYTPYKLSDTPLLSRSKLYNKLFIPPCTQKDGGGNSFRPLSVVLGLTSSYDDFLIVCIYVQNIFTTFEENNDAKCFCIVQYKDKTYAIFDDSFSKAANKVKTEVDGNV